MRYLKDYKIFENVDTSNTIVECLIYIFDKYNIPENGPDFIPSDEDENIFSWWSDFPNREIITICSIPDRTTTENILEDIMKEKKTIERRIKRKIKIERGYDYPMYRGGWIEIKLED